MEIRTYTKEINPRFLIEKDVLRELKLIKKDIGRYLSDENQ